MFRLFLHKYEGSVYILNRRQSSQRYLLTRNGRLPISARMDPPALFFNPTELPDSKLMESL